VSPIAAESSLIFPFVLTASTLSRREAEACIERIPQRAVIVTTAPFAAVHELSPELNTAATESTDHPSAG
jgi:hypothetical protein